jgi:hypothetical protein
MNNDPLEVLFRLRTTRYASSASRVVWCSGTRRLFLFFDSRLARIGLKQCEMLGW